MKVGDTEIIMVEDPWIKPDMMYLLTDEMAANAAVNVLLRIWWGGWL